MFNINRFKLLTILALATCGLPTVVVADEPAAGQRAPASETAELRIEGMVTSACPVLVKRAAGGIDGVRRVSASLAQKSARVEFDPGKTSVAEIVKVIKDRTGLRARPVTEGCTDQPDCR